MKHKLFVLISLAALFLSACGASPLASDPLNGTSWELFAISKHSPLDGTTVTLSFEDGQARGSSGCNSYGGAYQLKGKEVKFQDLEATVMACLEPAGVMEQESTYLGSLGQAQRFELSDGQLLIYWSEHEALTFVPAG